MNDSLSVVNPISIPMDIESKFPIRAKDVWERIGSQQQFSNWIRSRLSSANAILNIDYAENRIKNTGNVNSRRGRKSLDISVTFDMACQIVMLEETDKGRQFRQYFIDAKKKLQKLEQKQESVAYSGPITSFDEAAGCVRAFLSVADMFKVPTHLAQIEAVKETHTKTGVDFSNVLRLSPAQDNIKPEEEMLEPSDLAEHFGLKSGQEMNMLLVAAGLQVKGENSEWQPTPAAEGMSTRHAWKKGSKSGYNRKWKISLVREVLKQA